MRFDVVLRYAGIVVVLNAAFMLVAVAISLLNGTDSGFYPLLLSAVIAGVSGAIPLIFVERSAPVNHREGFLIVVGSWLLSCLVGMFPYLLWGGEFTLANTWFESVSGYTTTGATILNDIEALPESLLFWRSSTHWLGGIGVVMFTLVVLPSLGKTKSTLSSVELSTMARDNYRYRSNKILRIVLFVYIGLTALETVCLRMAGMSLFDAVNHSFSTVATGGFSTRNLSIAAYDSVWIEVIITFFMAAAGLHFGLIFATLAAKPNNIFRSEVSIFYISTLAAASLLVAVSIFGAGIYPDILSALRHGIFQVVSLTTTTGFATADTNLWTPFAIVVLVYMMIQCGCAGSTSGGMKADRVWLSVKMLRARIIQQQHPNAVIRIKLNGVTQDNDMLNWAMMFIVAYMLVLIAGSMLTTAAGLDIGTGFSITLSSLSNVGPGFGEISSFANFSAIPASVKFGSTLLMLLGRLEIFGLLQLFMFRWWR